MTPSAASANSARTSPKGVQLFVSVLSVVVNLCPWGGHSTLPDQTLALQRLLNALPHSRVRITHRQQQFCLFGKVLTIAPQVNACLAGVQVRFLFGIPAAFNGLRQCVLEFVAIHPFPPRPT